MWPLAPPASAATPVVLTLKGQWLGYARGPAWDVAVQGQYAYVADDWAVQVIDVSNPASPVEIGGFWIAPDPSSVQVVGKLAYVTNGAAGLHILDVSNPTNPVRVGGYDTSGDARDVAVVGDLIYVADGQLGLLIIELSRPPWLEVSGLKPFTFRVSGKPGATLRVQRSSNLQDWEDWQTVTLGDGPLEFPDPDAAGATARFYRAVKQ